MCNAFTVYMYIYEAFQTDRDVFGMLDIFRKNLI